MSNKKGRCPNCDNKIVQKSGSQTKLRIAHPVYFDESGACFAKCHWCKGEVELPIELKKNISIESERFTISQP